MANGQGECEQSVQPLALHNWELGKNQIFILHLHREILITNQCTRSRNDLEELRGDKPMFRVFRHPQLEITMRILPFRAATIHESLFYSSDLRDMSVRRNECIVR